ncbi:MAG: DMT family transporter [Desulfobacterales bacterium]|nr:DMT family transporter [Desulfobacterales bacterium]
MTRQQKAYLYAFAAVLIWSTVASAFKLSLRHLTTLQLLLWADVVSIICLFGVLFFQGKIYLLRRYRARSLMQAAGLGFLNPFLYYTVLFAAYDLLPAQEAQPLNYTWAITLSLLSIPLLKQRIGVRELLAIFISYFGVVVISIHGDLKALEFSNGLGVALALGSTVIWALYWIYNTRDENDPAAGLFLNFVFGFPFILIACLIFSDPFPDTLHGFIGAAYVGVFEMGITFVFWLNALKLTRSTARVSTLIFFSPFLSLVFIRIFVGELIRLSTVIGLIFIIAGSVLQQTGKLQVED